MPSREQVERWRDNFARVESGERFTNGDFQALADMLERAEVLIEEAREYAREGSEWFEMLDEWLAEWREEADDAE